MTARILDIPVWEVVKKIANQEISSEDYISKTLERIQKIDPRINAYITVIKEASLDKALELDKQIRQGKPVGRLAGLPIAIKDSICVKNIKNTCGSRMLENFVAPYNATVADKIIQEDGIIIGKTNLDEFAMGTSTEHSYFGATRNPWDSSKVPGGSSGGSAASIASFEAALALGSDTGGSIRSPASFCSVVGLKPTYGAVSRYGLVSYSNSLEQIGPIARDVRSTAILMDCINGHDIRDSTSKNIVPKRFADIFKDPAKNLKIGVPNEFFGEGVQKEVKKSIWNVIHKLEKSGFYYEKTTLPMVKYALPAYYIIAMAEASSNLARYDGLRYGFNVPEKNLNWTTIFSKNRRYGFGREVRQRIMLGTYTLSKGYFDQYYLKAQKIRTLIKKDFDKVFKKFDILLTPSMPILPFSIGEKLNDSLALYMCDVNTVPVNLAGVPSISIPCGLSSGLPIGIQIIAPPFREDLLFTAGQLIEENVSIDKNVGEFTNV
jgi:aspartyl-tRNA(Asn)/glutamyl-tRNA(Gln) amidotransferase subunit A